MIWIKSVDTYPQQSTTKCEPCAYFFYGGGGVGGWWGGGGGGGGGLVGGVVIGIDTSIEVIVVSLTT